MIYLSNFAGVCIDALRAIDDYSVIAPATFAKFVDDFKVLLGSGIAFFMVGQSIESQVIASVGEIGGDYIPCYSPFS
jgi:hypothetical protein